MVVSERLGIMSYTESVCVDLDQNSLYRNFTYDNSSMEYKPIDSFGCEFGILTGDLENHKHYIAVRSLDAKFIYYSDKSALLVDLSTHLDLVTKEMTMVSDKFIKCLELIESLD
jgi:hypothetical protein